MKKKILPVVALLSCLMVWAQELPDWQAKIYSNTTSFVIEIKIDNFPVKAGDIVGIFVGNECRFRGEIKEINGKTYAIGLIQGELVEDATLKLYSISDETILSSNTSFKTQPGGTIGSQQNPFPLELDEPTSPTSDYDPFTDPNLMVYDDFDGKTEGVNSNTEFVSFDGKSVAKFSQALDTRIEYLLNDKIAPEGTLEMLVWVESAYSYTDGYGGKGTLQENDASAILFTTDVRGMDTHYPGAGSLVARQNGDITWTVAANKYGTLPRQTLTATATAFRFGEWHHVGVSYGSKGVSILVDGEVVATDATITQLLSTGGGHNHQNDRPTIGESYSYFGWGDDTFEAGINGYFDKFRTSSKVNDWQLKLDGATTVETPTEASMGISVVDSVAYLGQDSELSIMLNNAKNEAFRGATFVLRYDTVAFEAKDPAFVLSSAFSADYDALINATKKGELRIAVWNFSGNSISQSENLGTLKLHVKEDVVLGIYPVTCEIIDLNELKPSEYIALPGKVEVLQNRFQVQFLLNFWNNGKEIANAVLELVGAVETHEAETDASGLAKFENVIKDNYTYSCTIPFREEHKRAISADDVSLGAKIITGLVDGNEYQLKALDVNLDGVTTATDLSILARFKVDLLDKLNDQDIYWVTLFENTSTPFTLSADTSIQATAVLLGDLTGNFAELDDKKKSSVDESIFSFVVKKGEHLKLNLRVDNIAEMNGGIDAVINTSEHLRILSVKRAKSLLNNDIKMLTNIKKATQAKFLVYTENNPLTLDEEFVEIELESVISGNANITLSDVVLDGKSSTLDLLIKERKSTSPSLRIHYPTTGQIVINYSLPLASRFQLNLYNSTGVKVKTLLNQNGDVGEANYLLSTQNLASGVYLLELRSSLRAVQVKMIVP